MLGGSASAQERAVRAAAVCLVNAARVCQNVILHELEIAALRRFDNVVLAHDARCSSSLAIRVSWGKTQRVRQTRRQRRLETRLVQPWAAKTSLFNTSADQHHTFEKVRQPLWLDTLTAISRCTRSSSERMKPSCPSEVRIHANPCSPSALCRRT